MPLASGQAAFARTARDPGETFKLRRTFEGLDKQLDGVDNATIRKPLRKARFRFDASSSSSRSPGMAALGGSGQRLSTVSRGGMSMMLKPGSPLPISRRLLVAFATLSLLVGVGVRDSEAQGPSGPVCGNGRIEATEPCDDGNTLDGDGCSSSCTIEQQCYDSGNVFSFFTWSDSYTSAGDAGVTRVFQDAVNAAKYPARVLPRLWFSTGDIPFMADGNETLDALNDEISNSAAGQNYPFMCSASNGKFPYFVAIGNHDVDGYNTTTPASQYDYWSNYVGPRLPTTLVGIKNYREGPSDSYNQHMTYSFDYKNAHFVVVNQYQGDPAYPTANPVACIRQAMQDWIDQDLAQTDRLIKFVFGHEPAWSYCTSEPGYGGDFCPVGSIDNLNPAFRPRPYSTAGAWEEPYGRHWGDSLESSECPAGSREAFWSMLGQHNVVAHLIGHTHSYGSRLVQGDGTRRNDVSPYAKTGQTFDISEGVWEVDSGQTHNSSGASYILTTVRDGLVTFEAFDQITMTEPMKPVETWSVRVGSAPSVTLTGPAAGATFTEPADITVSADAADLDGSVSQVAFYADSTLIGTAETSPYSVTWSGAAAGHYTLTAMATDNGGLTAISSPAGIDIVVPGANQAPVLAPVGNMTGDELVPLTFTAAATDPNPEDLLTFGLVSAPAGAAIDATSGAFDWTPTEAQGPGSYLFTVRVRDNGNPALSADETIRVTVNEVNRSPVLTGIGNKTAAEGSALTFTASASDPDLPTNGLAFSLVGAPVGATIGAASGAFNWTPNENQGGANFAFSVRVSDNGVPALSAEEAIVVTVNEVNQSPILAAIGNKTASEGTLLTFTASASDADVPPDTLSYSLVGAPAGASIGPVSGVFTWTPTSSQLGAKTFTVLVTDSGSPPLSASRSVTVTVSGRPDLVMTLASTATTPLAPGSSLSLSNTVRNQGGFSSGAFTVAFHLSQDAAYGGSDDVAFTTTRSVTSLAVGASNNKSTSLSVPATTPLGAYYVCAMADSAGAVSETVENNNSLCTTTSIQVTRADLIVTQAEPGASSVNVGAVLPIANTVQNQGLLSAAASKVAFRLSANTIYGDSDDVVISDTRSVGSLAAGAGSAATTSITIASTMPPGTYYVCARADSAGVVAEADENNNNLCSAGRVTIPPVDLTMSAASTTITSVRRGFSFSLSNTVENVGGSPAGSFVIAFHLSADSVYGGSDDTSFTATRSRSSLAVGASHNASTTLSVPAATPLGFYYVCALADSNATVAEGNENNNGRCTGTAIEVKP
jgi:cysteine-rich repeat protein